MVQLEFDQSYSLDVWISWNEVSRSSHYLMRDRLHAGWISALPLFRYFKSWLGFMYLESKIQIFHMPGEIHVKKRGGFLTTNHSAMLFRKAGRSNFKDHITSPKKAALRLYGMRYGKHRPWTQKN
jgi:hypothetical protein